MIEVFGADATPAFQPITYADGQDAPAAPPLLLRAGADDQTVRPANTPELAAAMRAAGGQADAALYPGIGHIGIITAFAPLFDGRAPVLDEVARFVTRPALAPPTLARPALSGRGVTGQRASRLSSISCQASSTGMPQAASRARRSRLTPSAISGGMPNSAPSPA